MPVVAMAWLLTGDRQFLESARQWALASCSYPTWGRGRIDGMDLATGHQLLGLALVYDWCYADLDDSARRTIRDTLVRRTAALYEAAATGKAWWERSYLQNHLWVNICGMAAAGLALFDEVEDASRWIGLPLDKFKKTMTVLGPDGASHEGAGYWEYGVEYMLKFMCLARTLLDVNLYRAKWTGQHNTLLVDGQGQLGEGQMWFDGSQALRVKARPRILRAESNAVFDHLIGDASAAYPRALGLRRYVRHLLFLKPDVLIVGDDILLDQPRSLELRFHPESGSAMQDGQAFVFETKRSILRLDPLTTDQVDLSAEDVAAADRHGSDTDRMFTIRLRKSGQQWRNAVALTWNGASQSPKKVAVKTNGNVWQFSIGERTVMMDWSSN